MKIKIIIALIVLISLGAGFVVWEQNNKTPNLTTNQKDEILTDNVTVIRAFMANPNLELSFVRTDLPMPYFRVGRITKTKDGENLEPTDDWLRQVNVYRQKDLIEGQCSVYEYHTDVRNYELTAVLIAGLNQNEIEALKEKGTPCLSADPKYNTPTITKEEAESIAFDYLKRAISNFEEIKDQFIYSKDKSRTWIWEDKDYQLPAGLEGRPYSYSTIRISVYDDGKIQYWNTALLFED